MKKFFRLLAIVVIPLAYYLTFNPSLVSAEKLLEARDLPEIGVGQSWSGQFVCTEENTISPKDAQAAGLIQTPYKGEDKFIRDGEGWCIDLTQVGAIHNYDAIGNGVLHYCPVGTAVGRKGLEPMSFNKGDKACCSIDRPFLYENWIGTNMLCCKDPGLVLKGTGFERCSESDQGEDPIAREVADTKNQLSGIFFEATAKYTCGMQNCFFKDGDPVTGLRRGTYTEDEINSLGLECFPDTSSGSFQDGSDPTPFNTGSGEYYCVAGDALTPGEYDEWKDKLNAYIGCKAFGQDTAEFNNCTSCLQECDACVYSALGCVNTSMNGLVTTIMRIAIGVLGAVGILRLMQAAILRQSGDPKDIQESWDIIMSVIIGAIVLVSSTLILRIIGINVLGILPYDF